jgi:hypothetical protein
MRKLVIGISLLLILLAMGMMTSAYEGDKGEVIVADALNGPRQLFMDADETIYIAVAGNGGETAGEVVLLGEAMIGTSGQIVSVNEDGQSVMLDGLFSAANAFGQSVGPHAVYVGEDTIWVVVGQGLEDDPANPENPSYAWVAYDRATLEQKNVINLFAVEQENNPDGGDIDSNPVDLVVTADGTGYVADAGANAILKVTPDGTVSIFKSWVPSAEGLSPVPTSLELDAEGNLYVGFLTGFPFLPGAAWIEKLDAEGNTVQQFTGLTLVTDVELGEDGSLYAVEFASGFGDTGFIPDSGRIVKVTEAGVEPVVTGLNFPYGLLAGPDGQFVVSVCSSFVEADQGQVILVTAGMDLSDAASPASTEDAAAPASTEEAPPPDSTEEAE